MDRGLFGRLFLADWLWCPFPREGLDGALVEVDGGCRRVERSVDPFGHLGMALVIGIGQNLEQVGVAPRAAAIFWRAAPLGIDQYRVGQPWHSIDDALKRGGWPNSDSPISGKSA